MSGQEHLLRAGPGTQTKCTCGRSFGSSELALQHQDWHLRLSAGATAESPTKDLITKLREGMGEPMSYPDKTEKDKAISYGYNIAHAHFRHLLDKLEGELRGKS